MLMYVNVTKKSERALLNRASALVPFCSFVQVTDKLLSLQLLQDIGAAHGKTPAQLAQDMQKR